MPFLELQESCPHCRHKNTIRLDDGVLATAGVSSKNNAGHYSNPKLPLGTRCFFDRACTARLPNYLTSSHRLKRRTQTVVAKPRGKRGICKMGLRCMTMPPQQRTLFLRRSGNPEPQPCLIDTLVERATSWRSNIFSFVCTVKV